jgi:DNA-binding CsgD family transcriptional regulator/catechol 2,3-dioxygenase-like lactoylglutathione lyase family enzyme
MSILSRRGRPRHPDCLTPAEWEVVNLVRHGASNRVIAEVRGTSVDAVKFHIANAALKLGLSGRPALKAWRGIPADSILPQSRKDSAMPVALQLGPIGQVSRNVSSLEQAEEWYKNVLGLRHLYSFSGLAFFDLGGIRLFLSEHPTENQSVLYFTVDDIQTAYEELQSRGIEFEGAPHLIHKHEDGTEEWMASFHDPDGGHLALMSQVSPN